MVGKDIRIFDGLSSGWDGCVSGLGNLCPELVVELYRSFKAGDLPRAQACQEQVNRLFEQVFELPVPWSIRIGLEVRGLNCGPVALPLAPEREKQAADFREWYRDWLAIDLPDLLNSNTSAGVLS
jgi:dihydrodipicolinate synthase/N-acetylneuraminate lyase